MGAITDEELKSIEDAYKLVMQQVASAATTASPEEKQLLFEKEDEAKKLYDKALLQNLEASKAAVNAAIADVQLAATSIADAESDLQSFNDKLEFINKLVKSATTILKSGIV